MDSTVQVVMGPVFKKRDTLADMPRFGGRDCKESEVFPAWLKEMYEKIKLDIGEVGIHIVKGEIKKEGIRTGDKVFIHHELI